MYRPAKFTPAGKGGFAVALCDILEALEMAEGILISPADFYFEDLRPASFSFALEEGRTLGRAAFEGVVMKMNSPFARRSNGSVKEVARSDDGARYIGGSR